MEISLAQIEDAEVILALQKANLRSPDNDGDKGFVELDLNLKELSFFINAQSAILAKENETLLGYLLVPSFEVASKVETIQHFIDELLEKNLVESNSRIFSICVSESARGQGLASKLYSYYRENFKEPAVSEVSEANIPSWRLHIEKEKMKILDEYQNNRGERVVLMSL